MKKLIEKLKIHAVMTAIVIGIIVISYIIGQIVKLWN